jgi:hypothetical protein
MNIEEIKLILDTLEKAGQGGADLFIFWVLLDKVPVIIFGLLSLWAGYALFNKLLNNLKSHSRLCELRDMANIGTVGELGENEWKALRSKFSKLLILERTRND